MKKYLHEIWEDPNGLPGLLVVRDRYEAAKKLFLEDNMKVIHTFYAGSHFEAMTIYYAYYGWGEYSSEFEEHDKLPYDEWDKL